MKTNWRPDGWVNPYYSEQQQGGETLLVVTPESESFEAGADAMLEGLKKQGWQQHRHPNGDIFLEDGDATNANGYLVFIPEEVKE